MAAIPLNSEKETLVPVRTKETVSAIDRWVTEEIGENEGFIIIGSDSSFFLNNLKCCHFVVTGQFRNAKVQYFQGFLAFRGSFPLFAGPCNLTVFV